MPKDEPPGACCRMAPNTVFAMPPQKSRLARLKMANRRRDRLSGRNAKKRKEGRE